MSVVENIRTFFRKLADWTDGYKTHIANVATFSMALWGWHKNRVPDATAFGVMFSSAISSICKLVSNSPGPLSRAANLPEAAGLKTAVRESQAVDLAASVRP